MVRVGGGWDTLSHYLDKHDPCRCRTQHRQMQGAKLDRKVGVADLSGAQVTYDRSAVPATGTNGYSNNPNGSPQKSHLGPPMNSLNRSRSRSPSSYNNYSNFDRRSVSPFSPYTQRKSLIPPPSARSRSPTPNYVSTHTPKLTVSPKKMPKSTNDSGPQSLPIFPSQPMPKNKNPSNHVVNLEISPKSSVKTEAVLHVSGDNTDQSDNASEVSDEGYRSLGIIGAKNQNSFSSQNSDDAEETERQNSIDLEDDSTECGKVKYSATLSTKSSSNPSSAISSLETTPTQTQSPSKISTPRSRQNSTDRTNNFGFQRSPSNLERRSYRRNSFDKTEVDSKITNSSMTRANNQKVTAKTKTPNINYTWNGRAKTPRPNLNDVFQNSNFTRNSATRRSTTSTVQNGRRLSQSAATSPTKSSLKEELAEIIAQPYDEATLKENIQKILQQYNFKEEAEKISKRRDSKNRENTPMSRIPAPVLHRS
jgi:hypothetical protein